MTSPALAATDNERSQENGKDTDESGSSDTSNPLDLKDDQKWEDVEPDFEVIVFKSLFDDVLFDKLEVMLEYCQRKYAFNLVEIGRRQRMNSPVNPKVCGKTHSSRVSRT
jgi:hypothetical protein